jgi:tetratricopeptide (TPR) repeat protein
MKVKKFFVLFIGCLITLSLAAQTRKINQSVKTIIQQRSIYLNGGTRAALLDGQSRTTIQIELPKGTASWYYSFSTSPGESGMKTLNLFAQLSSLALDPSGITKSALANIEVPSGSGSIDVYLMEQSDSDLFLKKVDNDGGTFYFKREGSVSNTKQALVEVNNFNEGIYYLGLKNPSSLDGVNIQIEVVAVIEEMEEQTEEQLQAITLGNLGWKAFERGDYNKCIECSKKALELDSSLGFVYFNIGLTYLMMGEGVEATTAYTKAISVTKKSSVPKETFKGAIGDLKTYMDKFPAKEDAQDILSLLKEEIKNY